MLVRVYRFTTWDQNSGQDVQAPHFATKEALTVVPGGVLSDRESRTVDDSELDGRGFYPQKGVWLITIHDRVSIQIDGQPITVPEGEYTMRILPSGTYSVSGPEWKIPFELSRDQVDAYLQGKMAIVAGVW